MSDLPEHDNVERVIAHYAPVIKKALEATTGVDKAVAYALAHTKKDAASDAHAKSVARGAVSANIKVDRAKLSQAVKDLYGDAGMIGTKAAMAQIGEGAQVGAGLSGLVSGINWNDWVPGHPEAALKVANGGLRDLLNALDIDLKGIDATTLDRLGNALADGIAVGANQSELAQALSSIISDPARAAIIADTETSRAFNVASLDTMQQNGIESFDWLAYDGACDDCLDEEANNPHDITDDPPPFHPNCRCQAVAVIEGITDSPLTPADSGFPSD